MLDQETEVLSILKQQVWSTSFHACNRVLCVLDLMRHTMIVLYSYVIKWSKSHKWCCMPCFPYTSPANEKKILAVLISVIAIVLPPVLIYIIQPLLHDGSNRNLLEDFYSQRGVFISELFQTDQFYNTVAAKELPLMSFQMRHQEIYRLSCNFHENTRSNIHPPNRKLKCIR